MPRHRVTNFFGGFGRGFCLKRVLVTGATGFLGRALCRGMCDDGWTVRGTFRQGGPEPRGCGVAEWQAIPSLEQEFDWNPFLRDVDCVVHAAAVAHRIGRDQEVSDAVYDRVNHQATGMLALAAGRAGVRRFVFVSSIGATTDMSEAIVNENTPCIPSTCYGRSKLAGERSVSGSLGNGDCDWVILRPTLMYGPGNPGNMGRLLRLVRLQVPIPLGGIRNRRSFLYVGNMVSAVRLVATAPAASKLTFCIADDEVLSTPDLIRAIGCATNRRVRMVSLPSVALGALGLFGDILERVTGRSPGFDAASVRKLSGSLEVSASLLKTVCGWRPTVSLADGMRETFGKALICDRER